MLLVVLITLAMNQNIIKAYHHKVTNKGFKDLICQSHKSTRAIRQIKWHNKLFT